MRAFEKSFSELKGVLDVLCTDTTTVTLRHASLASMERCVHADPSDSSGKYLGL